MEKSKRGTTYTHEYGFFFCAVVVVAIALGECNCIRICAFFYTHSPPSHSMVSCVNCFGQQFLFSIHWMKWFVSGKKKEKTYLIQIVP